MASQVGPVPVFLWKPIATCDCPGGGGEGGLRPLASRVGPAPVFLWKPIATCDFPGGRGGEGGRDPLFLPWTRFQCCFLTCV